MCVWSWCAHNECVFNIKWNSCLKETSPSWTRPRMWSTRLTSRSSEQEVCSTCFTLCEGMFMSVIKHTHTVSQQHNLWASLLELTRDLICHSWSVSGMHRFPNTDLWPHSIWSWWMTCWPQSLNYCCDYRNVFTVWSLFFVTALIIIRAVVLRFLLRCDGYMNYNRLHSDELCAG